MLDDTSNAGRDALPDPDPLATYRRSLHEIQWWMTLASHTHNPRHFETALAFSAIARQSLVAYIAANPGKPSPMFQALLRQRRQYETFARNTLDTIRESREVLARSKTLPL